MKKNPHSIKMIIFKLISVGFKQNQGQGVQNFILEAQKNY